MGLIKPVLLAPKAQELGKIKIGGRLGGRDGRPTRLDHFLITTMERDENGSFVADERIHSRDDVGPTPKELSGVLMHPTVEENFHSEMQVYQGRTRKVWTCDGELATNLETGEEEIPCGRANGRDCQCKPYGRLHLQLWAAPFTLGFHVFRTTSWTSISNIQTALQEMHKRFGTLYNAPVRLIVYPRDITYTGSDGEKKAGTAHVVGLVLAMGLEEAASFMIASNRELLSARSELQRIGAGEGEAGEEVLRRVRELDVRDEEEIGDDFHPDSPSPSSPGEPVEVGEGEPPPGEEAPLGAPVPPAPPAGLPSDEEIAAAEELAATEGPGPKIVRESDLESLKLALASAERVDKVPSHEGEIIEALLSKGYAKLDPMGRADLSELEASLIFNWIRDLRDAIASTKLDPPKAFTSPPVETDQDQGFLLPPKEGEDE